MLPMHKNGILYLEHCRLMAKGEKLAFLRDDDAYQKFWAVPYGNLNALLLGPGTSMTQKAAFMLGDEGVMVGFTAGGATPLYLASQSEYRPTEYMQAWAGFWFDEDRRLEAAKRMQIARVQFTLDAWQKHPKLVKHNLSPESVIDEFLDDIEQAEDTQSLLLREARYMRRVYHILADEFDARGFVRNPGQAKERFNSYIDHANYLAYGLAAAVLWALGISHSFALSHGKTRRGGLVFDLADVIKDGIILPAAFEAAANRNMDRQALRESCIAASDKEHAVRYMFDTMKGIHDQMSSGEA